jgi:hypothetical protein
VLPLPIAGTFGGRLYYPTDTPRRRGVWPTVLINGAVLAGYGILRGLSPGLASRCLLCWYYVPA